MTPKFDKKGPEPYDRWDTRPPSREAQSPCMGMALWLYLAFPQRLATFLCDEVLKTEWGSVGHPSPVHKHRPPFDRLCQWRPTLEKDVAATQDISSALSICCPHCTVASCLWLQREVEERKKYWLWLLIHIEKREGRGKSCVKSGHGTKLCASFLLRGLSPVSEVT